MSKLCLSKTLHEIGATCVGDLRRYTGSPEPSVWKQVKMAEIERFYRRNEGIRGPLGFPLGDTQFNGNTASRSFAGGQVKLLSDNPGGGKVTVVRIRYVGFRCIKESTWDQGSSSDEPYFIIGVAGTRGSNTVRFGPYEGVDTGTVRFEASDVAAVEHTITPPVVLGVAIMENDFGTPEEAEEKVRKVVQEMERKLDQAAGTFTGAATGSHVLPEWSRDILIGWVPEGIAAVFGMGDDLVGKTPMVLFDNKSDLLEWRVPPILGKHGPNEYNVVLNVDGGNQGIYDCFFKVDLADHIWIWK